MERHLDLINLENVIIKIEKSLSYCHSKKIQSDPELLLELKASAIQAFEVAYEVSWKMLKRFLMMTEADPKEIELISFSDLIRLSCSRGLLKSELRVWKKFRESRCVTSHTYNQEKAEQVFKEIPLFLKEIKFLLKELRKRVKK